MTEPLFITTGTVEAIRADMVDVSALGEIPGSHWRPTHLSVSIRTSAGSIVIPWESDEPCTGDRVRITVSEA